MTDSKGYIFGPVPSRRLGLSLGVDIVPFKVCTLDCIYCQLGRTTEITIERKAYVPIDSVIAELKKRLSSGVEADYITISGSGEPTLNSQLEEFIKQIKKITNIPVAVITNGTLFFEKAVRKACALADVVVPSLDAGDEKTFLKINRPYEELDFEQIVEGLCTFRREFSGQIWLEVFLVEGINTSEEQISRIKKIIAKIKPDKVQLNTAVRPTADKGVEKVSPEKMQEIAQKIGTNCEVVADFPYHRESSYVSTTAENVLAMLKRRPCSIEDICRGLNIHRNEALKYIEDLRKKGVILAEEKGGTTFFRAN